MPSISQFTQLVGLLVDGGRARNLHNSVLQLESQLLRVADQPRAVILHSAGVLCVYICVFVCVCMNACVFLYVRMCVAA